LDCLCLRAFTPPGNDVSECVLMKHLYMLQILEKFTKYSDLALASGIIAILMVLLFPIPTSLLDVLLAFSITVSILILMTTLFITTPLDLSVFPTILLVTTMLRLSLNIASTRLILANGHTGTDAAGHVIEAFGFFVMQGNVVIGLIVFLILTLINFIVITKGSGRIAEVAARFSLDAMPGKQMAIDADLAAGTITEEVAKQRRKNLEDESTFYGSMDGANKFVRGDAIAGIIITFVNLVGGIIIGMMQRDMQFDAAVQTYTILSIGDGLVTQIPALIVSLSAGLLVTRSGAVGSADKALFGQLSRYPQALVVSSVVSGLMALLPGLPFIPFFMLSVISGLTGYALNRANVDKAKDSKSTVTDQTTKSDNKTQDPGTTEAMHLEYVTLELGYGLIPLVNQIKGHRLTEQIKALRKQIIRDLGFVMPSVRIQDNMQLAGNTYVVKIKELECGRGEVFLEKVMVMDSKGGTINIPGVDTKEPTFGLPAKWVSDSYREEALFNNYTVVDPSTVITTHLTEIVKENITELLSYSETQKLLDELSDDHKKMVKDIVPDVVNISILQKVLQNLLAESVSIRDLPTILEATADASRSSKNIRNITEFVRMRLSRQICYGNVNREGFIPVVAISNEWEQLLSQSLTGEGDDKQLSMSPSKLQEFVAQVKKVYDEQAAKGHAPILLTSAHIRPYVRSIIERFRSATPVMSQNEIHFKAKIRTLGMV
jgi:flagellar biosynthesis protein FlhA